MLRITPALLLLLSANYACKSPSQPATTRPSAEVPEVPVVPEVIEELVPEPECDAFKEEMLRKAFAIHAGQEMPVRLKVDAKSGIHLFYESTTLSVETALLLASWKGPAWATRLTLDLRSIRTLDRTTAEALATWGAEGTEFSLELKLDGLKTLSAEVAEALSVWSGSSWNEGDEDEITWDYYTPSSSVRLSLNGVATLDAKAMRHLLFTWPTVRLGSAMYLSLDGLRVVPDDGLTQAQPKGADLHLALNGVSELNEAAATLVSTWPLTELSLSGLLGLDAKSASQIGRWQAKRLSLGLEVLEPEIAAYLATFQGSDLRLDNLRNLTAQSAKALLAWRGSDLALSAIETIDAKTATEILNWNARDLSVEKKITAEFHRNQEVEDEFAPATEEVYEPPTLEALFAAFYNRRIVLSSLKSDSQRRLEEWYGHRALHFAGVDSEEEERPERPSGCALEEADKQALAKLSQVADDNQQGEEWEILWDWAPIPPEELFPTLFKAEPAVFYYDDKSRLILSGDTDLDAKLIAKLEADAVQSLMSETKMLSPQSARALARWRGAQLYLNSVETLSKKAASALVAWKGDKLELDGLTSLSPDVAAKLSRWKGDKLELDGVTELPRLSAIHLAKWKGSKLELDGLRTISPAVAKALAKWPGKELQLDGLQVLDESALNALLAAKSTVSWDGHPMSSNRHLGGATVADKLSPQLADAMKLPSSTYTFHWLTDLRIKASSLTVEQAKVIVGLPTVESIEFSSLESITPSVAAVLATWKGRELDLSSLVSLDAKTARALANSECSEIKLGGVSRIDNVTAKALTNWKGAYLDLSGIETLSKESVRIFRSWTGTLSWLRYSILVAPTDAIWFSKNSDKDRFGFKNAYDLEIEGPDRRLEWVLTP